MPIDPVKLDRLAEVAVRTGVNLQDGQDLLLTASTDALPLARKIVELVEMDSPRPIRTQVGQDMGVEAVNEATAPIPAGLVEGLKPVYLPEAVAT